MRIRGAIHQHAHGGADMSSHSQAPGMGMGMGMTLHFSRVVGLLFPGLVTSSALEYTFALAFMMFLGFLRERLAAARVKLIFRPTSSNPNSRQERAIAAFFTGWFYVYDLVLMLFAMSMNIGVIFCIGLGITLGHYYYADDTLNEMRKTVLSSGCCT